MNLFHIYTVDAHTLLLVRFLRRFCLQAETDNFPFVSKVAQQIPKADLLYIAGLYHDIAKGRGGDHSQLGRKDAIDFCKRHHLGDWDVNIVAWLVEHHLTMSGIAQRRDISDPEVVQQFAQLVDDQLHLDYLYVLTIADINATNPKLWNSWRASLLRQLYTNTKRALARGLDNPIDKAKAISIKQQDALEMLPFNPGGRNQLVAGIRRGLLYSTRQPRYRLAHPGNFGAQRPERSVGDDSRTLSAANPGGNPDFHLYPVTPPAICRYNLRTGAAWFECHGGTHQYVSKRL